MTKKRVKMFFGPKMTLSENIGRPSVRSVRPVRPSDVRHSSVRPYPRFILTRLAHCWPFFRLFRFCFIVMQTYKELIFHILFLICHVYNCCRAQRGSTIFLTSGGFSRVHSTQSFARSMYSRHLDLVSVCLSVKMS